MKTRFDLFIEVETKDLPKLLSEVKLAQDDCWTRDFVYELLNKLRGLAEKAQICHTGQTGEERRQK